MKNIPGVLRKRSILLNLNIFRMLFFILTFLIPVFTFSATKTWTGTTNNDWNTGSNWGGTAPAAGDIANIPGGLANYPIINNSVTIATVNINSSGTGASITVQTGGTFNISAALTINANGSLIQSGGTVLSAGTLTVNGTFTQSGGLFHLASASGTNPTDNLVVGSGGIINQSNGTIDIKDWAAGAGTFNQTGSGALLKVYHDWKPGAGSVFNSTAGTVEFALSGGGGPNFSAGTRQFTNIIVDAGVDPGFDVAASSTIPISGNFTNNNTALNETTNASFTFNGTGAQTITSASTGTNATFGTLVINNSTTVTLASSIYLSGDLTVQQGTFDQATYTVTRTAAGGTFAMSAGTYLTAGGGIPSNWTSNNMTAGSTIEFNGSGSETIPAINYANLKSSNSGARVLASSGTIGISGTFTPGTNSYTITGSTINFNGSSSQTIPAFNYNNLTSSSSGARTLASSGTIGIAGTFTPSTNTYTITGSTIDFNGSGSSTIPAFDYNNLTSSSSGARTLASSGTIGISGIFTPGTNSYTNTGSTIDFKSSSSQTIPAFSYNNLTNSSSGARTLASSGTIGIAGNFTPGTNTYTVTGSTVDFNGSGAQNIGGITFNNLSTSNAGTKSTTGNITVNGTFTVNSPTIFSPGAAYTVAGSGTLTGDGTIQVTRITGTPDLLNQYTISSVSISSLGVDYIGAGAQTVNALNYGNLTISTNGTRTVTFASTGTIGVTGNFSPSATTTTYVVTGSTVDLNGSGAQSFPAFTFNNLNTSNAGTKSSSGNIVINGTFNVGSGTTFSPAAANIISGTGTLTGSGTVQVTRTAATPDFISQYTISNKTLASLTVEYNSTLAQTVNALNYFNLTVSGARTSNSVTYSSSGTIGISGTFSPVATYTTGGRIMTGSTLDFNGSGSQTIPAINYNNLTSSNTGARVLASSGTIGIASTWTLGSNSYTTTGSTVDLNGTGAQTVPVFTFNNLTVSGARTTNSVTLSSGTISLTGSFTSSATFTSGAYIVTGNTMDFSGSGSQTIAAINYNNLTSSSSGARVLASSGTIGIAGIFTPGTNSYTITGSTINFNGANGQTIPALNYNNLSSSNNNRVLASSGSIGIAGTFTPGSGSYTITGSTIDFNGSGSQTIPAFNYNNLTSSNSGARVLASSGTVGVAGNFDGGTNSFTVTGSTVNYNGSGSQSVAGISYNNLTVSNSGTKTFSSGTISAVIVTIAAGPTFSVTGGTLSVSGTGVAAIDIQSGGTLSQSGGTINPTAGSIGITGTFTQSAGTFVSPFNFILNGGGVFNQSGTGLVHLAINTGTTPTDNIVIASGGTVNQSGGTIATKDYPASAGTFNQTGSGALFKINHDWKPGTGNVFNATAGTVQFVIAAGAGANFAAGTFQFNNIIVDADPGFDVVAASNINISGDFTNNVTTINHSANATFTFNGSGTQNIYSASTGTNATFGNLVIDKNTGTAILTSNAYVAGNTTISNGTFDLGTYISNRKSAGGALTVSNNSRLILGGNTGGQTGSNFPLNYTSLSLGSTTTIEYNGSNSITQTIYATPTYGHLMLTNGSGSGTASKITTANITVTGNLTINALAVLTPAAANLISGTGTITGSGTAQVTRTAATPDFLSQYTISNRILSALTIEYAATGSQTINALNYFNLSTSGARTSNSITFASSGTVGVSGTMSLNATYTSGGRIMTGSTVDFNGAGNQTVNAITYNNLTVSGSGTTKSAAGALTVNGTLTTNSNVILDMVIYDLGGTLGTITNNGTIKTQSTSSTPLAASKTWGGTVEYNGSGGQTLVAGTFNILTINNSSGVAMTGNATVNTTITFTQGNITTSSNTISLASGGTVARTSGHVVGNFQKYILTGATSRTFQIGDATNYTPVTLAFGNVSVAGNLTASTAAGDHASIATSAINSSKSVNRTWTLVNSGVTFDNYSATFTFVSGDIDGGASTSSFIGDRYSGGSWTPPTVGTLTSLSTQLTGITAFGDFQIGEGKYSLSGNVFEDVNYGGGAGRSKATSSGTSRSSARVELYNSSGVYSTSTTTDGSGNYSFTGLNSGTYYVRVVNSSVTSSRTGYTSSALPVQTYRTTASSGSAVAVTDYVGGTDPSVADPGNGSSGATFNTTTFVYSAVLSGTAQSVTTAVISGTITGLDFGFNFNTIVNINNTGQGSLRQFITNANLLSNTGLAQSGKTSGIDNAIWMISNGTSGSGLRSANNYVSGGFATISPTSVLPTISDPVVIDGQTQPGWTSTPIIKLNGTSAGSGVTGFNINCSGNTLSGLAITAFPGVGVTVTSGTGNAILANAIYGNGGIGIDLAADGVSTNNGTKSGALPNSGMDHPVFTLVQINGPLTSLTVEGYVGSAAGQSTFASARVEIFKSDNDGSGYGEGSAYLGFLTADANGNFSGSISVSGLTTSDKITGIATDGSNNSSEFGINSTTIKRKIYSTSSGGNWSTGGSWTGGVAPTSDDIIDVISGSTITLDGNITRNAGDTSSIHGTLAMGTYVISGAGDLTLYSAGTLTIGSSAGITSSGATGNIQVTGSRTYSTSGNYTYNGSSTQSTGNGLPATVNNLTINNSTGVNLTSSVATNGVLQLTSGVFGIGTNTLSINSSLGTTSGSLSSSATGTVIYNVGGAQTILIASYGNLTLANSGVKTFSSGTTGVAGALTLTGSATADATTNSTSIDFNGSSAQTIPAITYYNLTASNSGSTKTAGGNLVVNGTLTTNSNVTLDMSSYTLSGTLGTITNNGTIKTQNTSSTPIPTGKTWGGTVEYNKSTGGQTIMAGTYNNLTNSNTSGTNTASGAITVNATFTMNASSVIDMVTYALSGTLASITGAGTLKTQNTSSTPIATGKSWSGTIEFNSATGGQTIVAGTYNNITNTNTSGTNSAGGALTVNGTLTLNTSSVLDMATYAMSGSVTTESGTGLIKTQNTSGSPLPSLVSWAGTVEYNKSTGGQTIVGGTYVNLTNSNTSGTNTVGAVPTVNGVLTLNTSSVLDMSTYALIGALTSISGTGTLKTQSTSASPLPSSKTWPGLVEYNRAAGGQTIVPGTYTNFTNSNTSGTNTASGAFSVSTALVLNSSSVLDMATYALSGALTSITGTGTLKTQNTSGAPIPTGKTWPGTVEYNKSTGAQTIMAATYNNLTNSNTSGTNSASGAFTVDGTFTLNASSVLDMVTYALSGSLASISGTGTLKTQNITSTPIPAGKTWPGTIEYNKSTGAQTIVSATYNNLTNSNTSGANSAAAALTINGILTMNASSTLDMVTYALSGSLSSVTGTGTLKTQNTTSTPVPTAKTWTGSFYYNSSSAQTIVLGNYNDLNGTGGNRTLLTGTTGIAGTFTVGGGSYTVGTAVLDFNGSGAQTIPSFAYYGITASGGNTKTLGAGITVADALTLGASTTLALSNYNITLLSGSSSTARVAEIPATASVSYGTGRFIAQRYVMGRRKYRLTTSQVTSSPNATLVGGEEALSIWGNWQRSGDNSTANAGTIITGGASGDGFDQQTTNASMYTYDDAGRQYVGFSTANSKKTKYTPLKAGIAYYLFIYGDRLNNVSTSTPNYTVISSTGKILTGDQAYTTSSTIPLTNVTNRYTMLGNPFASPINWATIPKTNLSNTYWGWDPNLSSTGGYITVSTAGSVVLISPFTGTPGLNQYIQSGQGFFVKTTGAGPTMTIREQDKISNYNVNAFTPTTPSTVPLMAFNLYYDINGTKNLADGAVAAFDQRFSNALLDEDAEKMLSPGESLSIGLENKLLSINARLLPQENDTIFLKVAKLTRPEYTLQIFGSELNSSNLSPFIEDTYLKTLKPLSLSDTNNIVFSVDPANPATADSNRFRIIFKKSASQPVSVVEKPARINVFPNPVTGKQINFRLENLKKGHYSVGLYNSIGEIVISKSIEHTETAYNYVIGAERLAKGTYIMKIYNSNVSVSMRLLIQ